MNRIYVQENPSDLERYFATNFELVRDDGYIVGTYTTDKNSLIKTIGWKFAVDFFEDLDKISGITFNFSKFQVKIKLRSAMKWSEIESSLFVLVEKYYGKFYVERESWMKRLAYKIRRNVLEPLFPKLYK